MKTKLEQIEAILSMDTFKWAIRQLSSVNDIENKKYSDFISVSEEEVFQYVSEFGFNDEVVVWKEGEDRICIIQDCDSWNVFYLERGIKSQLTKHADKTGAIHEVIHRLINSAKISLNHRYKNTHPEEALPKPSEM